MNKNKIFAKCCNLYGKLSKVKDNRVTLIEKYNTGFTGNLKDVHDEILRRDPNTDFNIIYHHDYSGGVKGMFKLIRLFTYKAWRLMTSKQIYLNDNFMPMAYTNFKKEQVAIQLWHGMGSFKHFGIPTLSDPVLIKEVIDINKNIDAIIVNTSTAVPIFAKAFGVDESKIKNFGLPQADFYLKEHDIASLRKDFEKQYPECKGKKLILYAPTFRDTKEADDALLDNFDFKLFEKELSDEYHLLLRLHPQVHENKETPDGVTNVTKYPSIRELLLMSDIMIADYSSVTIEFALLNKPIIMFPFDYDRFSKEDRGFFFDYFEQAPGPICHTTTEIIECIKSKNFLLDKVKAYAELHNEFYDCNSVKRIVDFAYNKKDGEV